MEYSFADLDNSRAKITTALFIAAEDLGIEVTGPYIIGVAEGRFTFVALAHGLGIPRPME